MVAPQPRYRATGRKIIAEGRSGPIHQVWEAHGAAMAFFDTRQQNDLMRSGCQAGGEYWVAGFLLLRFDQAYVKRLGYAASNAYLRAKDAMHARGLIIGDRNSPLVYSGQMREHALKSTRVETRATAKRQTISIKIPPRTPSHRW